uniref:Uncharacterized protein n=1 Tax=Rhizophora mucronata TaxID=61149 RepID=A0A2P2PHU5_RHIMU
MFWNLGFLVVQLCLSYYVKILTHTPTPMKKNSPFQVYTRTKLLNILALS